MLHKCSAMTLKSVLVTFLFFHIAIVFCYKIPKQVKIIRPPSPRHGSNYQFLSNKNGEKFSSWTPKSDTNLWEHSGLLEGDIMTYNVTMRNGIINQTLHWPNAIVPFFIDENDFDEEQIKVILNGIKEYHNRTCIRFKPYTKNDTNWIIIKGNNSGCWSSVGMHTEGQVVNLMNPKCVRHGVVIHELLHALGFYHQQSAADRDDYVKINWENIVEGAEHNFNKYNETHVTDYNVEYDYGSVMHYSEKAFSKNGKPTIKALQENVTLGQRKGLSEKDVIKLNKMYRKSCSERKEPSENDLDELFDKLVEYFENKFASIIQ